MEAHTHRGEGTMPWCKRHGTIQSADVVVVVARLFLFIWAIQRHGKLGIVGTMKTEQWLEHR